MNKNNVNLKLLCALYVCLLGCLPILAFAAEEKTPIIEISEPANNSITYENKIVLRGKTYNTVKLFLENRPVVLNANGEFNAPFTIPFYGSHYIKMIAYNKLNENSIRYFTINYIKQSDRPAITIIAPENNTKTGTNTIRVRGYVNNCNQVYIDKKPIKLIKLDGKTYFDEEVHLLFVGLNKIVITGHNSEDKDLTEELTIIKVPAYKPGQDTKFMIYFPVNNLETTSEKIHVKGKGVNITKVYINDELTKVDKDYNFDTEIPLQFGSNAIEIVGIGPNDVSIKEVRNVLRLNNEMEKQKSQVIHVETKDANRKLTSFDYVVAEKDRLEEKLNLSIQKIIDSSIGPGKAIFSIVINLNTVKIKNELDREYDGDIGKFIQTIDCNIVIDSNSKKHESEIKTLIKQNIEKFAAIKQTYAFKYINFSNEKNAPFRMPEIRVTTRMEEPKSTNKGKENSEASMLNDILIKQQAIETALREFYQKYIDHVVGDNHAVIDFSLQLNKNMLKNALVNKQEDEILANFDQYVVEVKTIILFDNSDSKQFEDKIKTLLSNSIKRFGNYTIKTEFIYEKFNQRQAKYNPQNLQPITDYKSYFLAMIVMAGLFIMLVIVGMVSIYVYLRHKILPLDNNAKAATERGSIQNNLRLTDLPSLMNRSEKINISHTNGDEKTFFSFINENNIHKLKLVLGLQVAQDQASVETIAIIVSYMTPSLAAKVIMMYPPKIQAQIMDLLIEPAQYPAETIAKLEKEIKSNIEGIVGGNTHLLQVLENLSQKTTKSIFDELEKKYPETFNSLKPSVIIFEDILQLDDVGLETLLKEIDPKNIANSICIASEPEIQRVYSLLSGTGKEMVQEWIDLKKSKITELETEESRRFIISVAQILESMGEIKIPRSRRIS